MKIHRLDHVNLRTTQLSSMVSWYTEFLELTDGPRPDFPFPGAWLYAEDCAVVHLVGVETSAGTGSETALKLEHFAFRAAGQEDFEAKLKKHGERFEKAELADSGLVAFNIWDPDGNHIHVDFPLSA